MQQTRCCSWTMFLSQKIELFSLLTSKWSNFMTAKFKKNNLLELKPTNVPTDFDPSWKIDELFCLFHQLSVGVGRQATEMQVHVAARTVLLSAPTSFLLHLCISDCCLTFTVSNSNVIHSSVTVWRTPRNEILCFCSVITELCQHTSCKAHSGTCCQWLTGV